MRSNTTQFTSMGSTLAPPPQPPQPPAHQQQMVMNGSVISAPVFMPQQQQRPQQQQQPQQQMFLNPSQSMNQLGQMSAAPSTVRMVSQPYLPSATPMPMSFPSGPLPQTPKAFHQPQFQTQSGYKMMQHDPSSDSISSAQNFQVMSGQQQQQGYASGKQITDSPQLSSSGRGSGRTDDSTDSGSIPRAPSPLSISKPHKLVPGRMTTAKERKREIPSTAV